MEIKDIKRLVELVKANELTELSIKDADFELAMKRGGEVVYASAPVAAPVPAAPAPAGSPAAVEVDEDEGLIEVLSPIVGTFYRKPAPDADSFVQIGTEVEVDMVVCIVEAMKVMNEIKSEVSGVVKKILVDDATPVQYGQPLYLLEPK